MSIAYPYLLLLATLAILGLYSDHVKQEKYKIYLTVVGILIFFFFFGFRGFIAGDWTVYYPFFKECDINNVLNYSLKNADFEPGFTLLCVVCKYIYNDWSFFQIVVSIIDTTLLIIFLRKTIDNIPYGLMIYITFNGIIISTDLMRNSIAIMIFINSLHFIKERRIIPYMGLCLLALTFHTSSLLFFPLYFFLHKRCNKWIFLFLFIIGNIIFILHIPVVLTIIKFFGIGGDLQTKVTAYTELMDASKGLSIGYIERLFTGLIILIYYDKLKKIRPDNAIYFNGLAIYLIMFLIFSEFQVLSERITLLFSYGYWVVWIDLMKCFYHDNNRRLFKIFVVVYCLLRTYGSVSSSTDFIYDNILINHKSYEERLYIKNRKGGLQGQ